MPHPLCPSRNQSSYKSYRSFQYGFPFYSNKFQYRCNNDMLNNERRCKDKVRWLVKHKCNSTLMTSSKFNCTMSIRRSASDSIFPLFAYFYSRNLLFLWREKNDQDLNKKNYSLKLWHDWQDRSTNHNSIFCLCPNFMSTSQESSDLLLLFRTIVWAFRVPGWEWGSWRRGSQLFAVPPTFLLWFHSWLSWTFLSFPVVCVSSPRPWERTRYLQS